MKADLLQHLLILCCYGGVPYIDYSALNDTSIRHESTMTLDPTDWIAVDSSGSLLNDTIHPEIISQHPELITLIPPDTSLDQCDLYNLTFSSAADQHLFEIAHGHLSCRCPQSRAGVACEAQKKSEALALPAIALALIADNSQTYWPDMAVTSGDPFTMYMLVSVAIMAFMVVVFMLMRGCFCDCLGGFAKPMKRSDSKPLDPVAVGKCLNAVRDFERDRNVPDHSRPLITPIASSHGFAAPYNDTIQRPTAPLRSYSPPPPYPGHGSGSDYLPAVRQNTHL